MLNEFGEYEQYTLSSEKLRNCKNRRLKYYNVKNSFSGLERLMTIITRHFIFHTPVGSDEDELREILKAWCGFNHKAKTILPEHFNGWLNNYIKRVLAFETACECFQYESLLGDLKPVIEKLLNDRDFDIKEPLAILENFKFTNDDVPKRLKENTGKLKNLLKALDDFPNKGKNFSKNLFGVLNAEGDTPFRAITYDRIIANALLAGGLRCYCLACDEELFQTNIILKDGKKLSLKKDKDIILKMTAEYLLQRRDSNQEFIVTNNANMMNWLTGEKPDYSKRESYAFAETNEKLFEIIKIEGINVTKVKLHSEWAKHFRLIEDGDEKQGRIFFSDNGSSEPLKESRQL
ncbi:MAG: hypothetical protein IJK81_11550 [Selenomonadaceae bacterium]|nr:hypothetical protein [Selenomonadaceae bacterium]